MNAVVQQDTDSGTGQVVTPGEPVDHVDMQDGVSVGTGAEPPAEPAAEPAPEVHEPGNTVSEKPEQLSRDEIYSNASAVRDAETDEALAGMEPHERAHYHRMVAEAQGVTEEDQDPFDGEGNLKEGWTDEGSAAPTVADPAQPAAEPQLQAPAAPAPVQQTVDPSLDTQDQFTTIIVYGEKREVPTAEVVEAGGVANFQKIVAADEKMKRASTYEASLRALDQQLSARLASADAGVPQATDGTAGQEPPPTGAQDETVDVQAAAENLVGAMYTGDREAAITQAAEVLASFKDGVTRAAQATVAQSGAQTPTPAEQQEAIRRATAAEQERTDANQVFVNEFKDLSSPVLRDATYAMVQKVSAEPIMYGRPLAEITREAAMRVRSDVFGDAAPAPTPDPVTPQPVVIPQTPSVNVPTAAAPATDLASRMALKSRTVVQPLIPQGGARFADAPAATQKTESNSDYITRMKRESRGQGV